MSSLSPQKLLEGRPLGHPLHPLLSHLPLGLWLFALALDVVSISAGEPAPWATRGAYYCLLIGSAVAILAAITGINDWLDIRADHPAQRNAVLHMVLLIPATLIFILDTVLHFGLINDDRVSWPALALSAVGYLLALAGGYLGGTLIYNDGIAVGRHRRDSDLPTTTLTQPGGHDAAFTPLVPLSVIAPNATLRAEIHGTTLAVANIDGRIYAVQEFCTHRCGPLSEGTLHGCEIQCPWHNSRFDLQTGQPTRGPAKIQLKTFETRIIDGIVQVRISGENESPASARPAERRNPPEPPGERDPARSDAPRRAPAP